MITKDTDFLDSYHIKKIPAKLLIVTTGNIRNSRLYELFEDNFEAIIEMLNDYNLVEINNYNIIGHE